MITWLLGQGLQGVETMARTITATQTYARFALLELQVRALLRESAELSEGTLDRVSRGLRDPHYIEIVIVQGLYPNGKIGAELELSIDWRTHTLELKSGGGELQVPGSWDGGIAPSIKEGVRTFLIACQEAGLAREFSVVYGSHFDRDEVNRLLGFVRGKSREWARPPEDITLALGPLREASFVVRLGL